MGLRAHTGRTGLWDSAGSRLGWETAAGHGQGCSVPALPRRSLVTPHASPTAPHKDARALRPSRRVTEPGDATCTEPSGSSWWGHPRSLVASVRLGAGCRGCPRSPPPQALKELLGLTARSQHFYPRAPTRRPSA